MEPDDLRMLLASMYVCCTYATVPDSMRAEVAALAASDEEFRLVVRPQFWNHSIVLIVERATEAAAA